MEIETIDLGKMVFVLLCRGCALPIVLPRQSPLGTYCSLSYQPTGAWPIKVVCPRIERVFSYSEEEVDLHPVRMLDRMTNLWEIVSEDDRETTGELKEAYTHIGGRDPRKIALAALGWTDSPKVTMRNLEY